MATTSAVAEIRPSASGTCSGGRVENQVIEGVGRRCAGEDVFRAIGASEPGVSY
jgi:hypothetical protein